MTFEVLETFTKANMPPKAKLSYMRAASRAKSGGKRSDDAKPQMIVSIPTTICGTAKAKKFQLLLGTGANAGKIRIKGSSKDGIEPKELMHSFVFGFVPRLGDDIFDSEHHPVKKISDDEFEIEVPASWFGPRATND